MVAPTRVLAGPKEAAIGEVAAPAAVFASLFRRIPTLALAADLADLPFMDDGLSYGLKAMPMSW